MATGSGTGTPASTSVNDYCIVADVKEAMPDGNWGSSYDTLIDGLIARASRLFDKVAGKNPGAFYVSVDTTRYFEGSNTTLQKIADLAAQPTSVSVSETGSITTYTLWASTDYILMPYDAPDLGRPYTELLIDTLNGSKAVWYKYPKSVKIVGKFGYAVAVPDLVKEATIMQTAKWLKRGQQAFQDTGAIVELGRLTYTKKLDPEVALIAQKFRGSPH